MKKRKGSLETAHDAVATAPRQERRAKRGAQPNVAMTIRLNRETWNELTQMAMADHVSVNELILNALNRERQARGLPLLKPALTKAELKQLTQG
jgi:hypothetical protein